MTSDFTVISYGTEGAYEECLCRLSWQCCDAGLDHDMTFLPAMPRIAAYLHKPTFILNTLNKLDRTVVWLDADTTVLRRFELPDGDWDVGVVPNTQTKSLRKNPTSSFVLAFRPTEGSRILLGLWKYLCDWRWLSAKRQDHKRLTWAREISEGRHTEIDLTPYLRGALIRDAGTPKEAAL